MLTRQPWLVHPRAAAQSLLLFPQPCGACSVMAIIPLVQRLMGCFRGATGGATGVGRAWTTSNLGTWGFLHVVSASLAGDGLFCLAQLNCT